jgi:hypothetical protein
MVFSQKEKADGFFPEGITEWFYPRRKKRMDLSSESSRQ